MANSKLLDSRGLPLWLSDKESACQCRRHGFSPWARKIPWKRKWLPTHILAWKIPWTEEQAPVHRVTKRVGYNWLNCNNRDTIPRLQIKTYRYFIATFQKPKRKHSRLSYLWGRDYRWRREKKFRLHPEVHYIQKLYSTWKPSDQLHKFNHRGSQNLYTILC